jgi:hypothetical protein
MQSEAESIDRKIAEDRSANYFVHFHKGVSLPHILIAGTK